MRARECVCVCLCLHVRVQLELVGLVSHGEVALSDPVAARLEGHLVPGQPTLVAHHGGPVDGRAVDVVVDVAAQVEVLALVGRLDLAALLAGGENEIGVGSVRKRVCCWSGARPGSTFLPSVRREGGVERQLQPLGQLNAGGEVEKVTTGLSD